MPNSASEKSGVKKKRWYEAFAPAAQMFRGLGKGFGRGRGPRLSETPKPPEENEDFDEVFR